MYFITCHCTDIVNSDFVQVREDNVATAVHEERWIDQFRVKRDGDLSDIFKYRCEKKTNKTKQTKQTNKQKRRVKCLFVAYIYIYILLLPQRVSNRYL